jgi:hypothetical protein
MESTKDPGVKDSEEEVKPEVEQQVELPEESPEGMGEANREQMLRFFE